MSTTTIRVWRDPNAAAGTQDPWESTGGYTQLVADGVRATIAAGNGVGAGRTVGPGDSEAVVFTLSADPCDLQYLDEVEDIPSGQRFGVSFAVSSPGLFGALASVTAGLTTRKGA